MVAPENMTVVEARLLRSGPSISGDLTPEREATIRAEVGGAVLEVRAEEGQPVRRGAVLAVLDESGIAEQYRSARSGLATAENTVALARREAERTRRLVQGGALAERDVEVADRSLWAAESQVESARAGLATAERQLQKTQPRAPFDGVVGVRGVSVGDVVQPGTVLLSVVDPSSMRLEASVPASALAVLKVGSPVQFAVSGYGGQAFTGTIRRISPSVDPATRQVRVTITIPNTGALVAGLFAEGRVATEEKTAVALPLAALDLKGPTPTVRRVKAGRVEVVAVQLGLRDEVAGLIEVTGGVTAGDTVLVGGAASIAPGTPVMVRKE
jgi:RND family efflux transporter MFP subunit